MALQNFVDQVGPEVDATWLNGVDQAVNGNPAVGQGAGLIPATPTALLTSSSVGGQLAQISPLLGAAATPAASAVTYTPSGTGALATNVQASLGVVQSKNVFDAFSAAQIADVQGNTLLLDVTAALATADGWGVPIYLPVGSYKVSGSHTFVNPVTIYGTLHIGASQTITFNQTVTAGLYQIFSLGASALVVMNPTYTYSNNPVGFPEWWGAVPWNTGVDNSVPINACIVACPVTVLQQAVYWHSNPILLGTGGRSLVGVNPNLAASSGDNATLSTSSATINQLIVGVVYGGSLPYTGTIQNMNAVRNIAFVRSVAPTVASECRGILVEYTSWCELTNLFVQDSIICYHFVGTSSTRVTNCQAWKHLSIGTTDKFYGFFADGTSEWINLYADTQNASLHLTKCSVTALDLTATTWHSTWDFQGLLCAGTYGWSDVFVDTFETNGLGQGVQFVGNGNTTATFDLANRDVRCINLVLDSCFIAGITFSSISLYGSIQITHGYINFAPTSLVSSPAPVAFNYGNSMGSILVTQMEVDCQQNTAGIAVYAAGSAGIDHRNNVYYETTVTPLQIVGTTLSRFEDRVRNYATTCSGPVVTIGSSATRNLFDMSAEGASGAFTEGYSITDNTTTYSEYRCTGLNAGCITGYKLDNQGAHITTVGLFGTSTSNLAGGVLA